MLLFKKKKKSLFLDTRYSLLDTQKGDCLHFVPAFPFWGGFKAKCNEGDCLHYVPANLAKL